MVGGVLAGVRFLSELALLAGVAWLGALLGRGGWLSVLLAILGVVVIGVLWGLVMAPRAKRRLPDPPRLIVEIVLYAGTAAALAAVGHPVPAIIGGVITIAAAAIARPLHV